MVNKLFGLATKY